MGDTDATEGARPAVTLARLLDITGAEESRSNPRLGRHAVGAGPAVVFAAIVLAGLVAFGLAWRGAAAEMLVARQLPWLVSGGLGGLGLVATGSTLLAIHHRRRE